MTKTTTAVTNSITIYIAPTQTFIINLADPFQAINPGSSKKFFNGFTFDDDIMGCKRGCKNSLNIFKLWLRLLGKDGDANKMIGGVKSYEENVYDFCISDSTSKQNEFTFCSQDRLDVLGNRMIRVMNDVIKLLLGNYSSTKCRMLEVILELGPCS